MANKFKNFSLLISRSFSFLWLFHLLSLFGSEMTRFALPVWFYEKEKNIVSFTIFLFAGLIPRVLSPISGALIDYLKPKKALLLFGFVLILISFIFFLIISDVFSINLLFIY